MIKVPESIFVDSSAWVALADKRDQFHPKAVSAMPAIVSSSKELLTSNLVLAETCNIILHDLGMGPMLEFIERLNASPKIRTIYSQEHQEKEAVKILKKYHDQDFSYTDAVSFALMDSYKVNKAFCFDRHFMIVGFQTVP
jgi:predicted nucleic acid-binding protein